MRITAIVSVIFFSVLIYIKPPISRTGYTKDMPTPVTEYYSSGEIRATGMKVNNKKEGPWVYYDLNGKIENEVLFKQGELIDAEEE